MCIKEKDLLPILLSLWFVLANLFLFFRSAESTVLYANYVVFIGEVVFDLAAVFFAFKTFTTCPEKSKQTMLLFTIAFSMLFLTDFMFHAIESVGWFFEGGRQYTQYYDIPFLAFVIFQTLGIIRLYTERLERRGLSIIANLFIILVVLCTFGFFISGFSTGNLPLYDELSGYLFLETVCGGVSFVLVMLLLAKLEVPELRLFLMGYLMLLVTDYFLNLKLATIKNIGTTNLEVTWLLAVMLMAGGLFQYSRKST